LKLRARDIADMDVIAACLQDALLPVAEMTFQPREGRFVMVANRFMWELAPAQPPAEPTEKPRDEAISKPAADPAAQPSAEPGGDAAFEDGEPRVHGYRVNCGVTFDRVRRVRTKAIDLADKGRILNLLTAGSEPGAVTLLFSDGAAIRLEVSDLRCHLEDLGEPWPTWSRPEHDLPQGQSAQPGQSQPGQSGLGQPRPGRSGDSRAG